MSTFAAAAGSIEPANYRFIQEIVYHRSGIVLDHDKHYLLEARLASIARARGLSSVNELCALIRDTQEEDAVQQIVEAMTTNETYFFREPWQYDAIRWTLLPELRQRRQTTRKLSFWSAAASTGQEAYSLAILLAEEGLLTWNLHFLGTDFSSKVVERARAGRYLQLEANRGLPTTLLLTYFQREGIDWQLNESIRRLVQFEPFDLRQSMRALGPFDLVLCRNVLIYFDATTRLKILRELRGTLQTGGWLLLGTAEVPFGMDDFFERRTIGASTIFIAR